MLLRSILYGFILISAALAQESIRITIHGKSAVGQPIPPTIFGSFLEPIGNSTYNGLWAEIIQNSSFEDDLWSASAVRDLTVADPQLIAASQLGLPIPWEPLHADQANRYEPRRVDAANSYQSIALLGLPESEVGIRQEVYLPLHRVLKYRGSLFVRHLDGGDLIRISLRKRNRPDQILASAEFRAASADWRKYTFELALQPGALKRLEPADFAISVGGNERALVDQASLMPVDAISGLDPDMVKMAKQMQTPLVRFGGNFTSAYHWRDGIGPSDKRISTRNVAWGIPETNQFGTDEFLKFCELIDAQPQIALNLGTGTPEEAADWVQYVDQHSVTHGGLLWELGNELWGNWNTGYPALSELSERTLQFSQAIRRVDPKARLIATGQDPDRYQVWNAKQLSTPPGTFDFLSTHFVVTTDRMAASDASLDAIALGNFALPIALERTLRDMQKQIDDAGQPNTHIAFTEWLFYCCSTKGDSAPDFNNLGGAVAAGGMFNMLLRNSDIVPVSDMTGIIEFAGIWKKRSQVYGAPSYYVFRMFSTAEPNRTLKVDNASPTYDVHRGVSRFPEIDRVPYLDAVAVENKKGDGISLFCVNRNLHEDSSAEITLEGFRTTGIANVQELFSQSIYDVNDELHPAVIRPRESTLAITGSQARFLFRRASVTRIDFKTR
ncbi:MAG: alpha-L-arabinofuranosidase C-terminal domain-containing protein [Bryobacteraceae bacterium]